MINDESLNRTAPTRYLETEAVHYAVDGGDNVVVVRIVSRQIEIVRTSNPGFIQDKKSEIPA